MEGVSSWDDLSLFVVDLLEDHEENPDQWNNYDLYPFLDAIATCIATKRATIRGRIFCIILSKDNQLRIDWKLVFCGNQVGVNHIF